MVVYLDSIRIHPNLMYLQLKLKISVDKGKPSLYVTIGIGNSIDVGKAEEMGLVECVLCLSVQPPYYQKRCCIYFLVVSSST